MMNINCSENCVHQQNGKCILNRISTFSTISSSIYGCAYFKPKAYENMKNSHPII